MRVGPFPRPINRPRFRTHWVASTGHASSLTLPFTATTLFLAASGATLAIGFREPLADYFYETIVFLLAARCCLSQKTNPMGLGSAAPLAGISTWGFFQLALGATVYRFATVQTSLRFAALGATAWIGFRVFGSRESRIEFLRAFSWFGAVIGVISVLGYFTSPGKILWVFNAPYPDIWGPFLSRNNFAQFLELAMPVALWFALQEKNTIYLCLAAVMLASGFASASRAGACILVVEAVALLWMHRKSPFAKRMALGFLVATLLFAALPGVGTLAGRLTASDPFEDRREIAQSTLEMIAERPWTGFGLGAFPVVYPEYAIFDVGQTVDHAHNDWLEWTSEGGFVFSAMWVILAVGAVRPALATGWGLGVLGCFLHATVDYPFARFGISAWVFILLGMLAATKVREVRHRRH